MAMNFEELDETTRHYMLTEFEAEEASDNPYRSTILSAIGIVEFPGLIRQALRSGDEQTLISSLSDVSFWNRTNTHVRRGNASQHRINIPDAARRLGLTEFNTWYVRGLAKRLIVEEVTFCQIYRAAPALIEESSECKLHENKVFPVETIYFGHCARYWPKPANPTALSVPLGPNCHHTIRRYLKQG